MVRQVGVAGVLGFVVVILTARVVELFGGGVGVDDEFEVAEGVVGVAILAS